MAALAAVLVVSQSCAIADQKQPLCLCRAHPGWVARRNLLAAIYAYPYSYRNTADHDCAPLAPAVLCLLEQAGLLDADDDPLSGGFGTSTSSSTTVPKPLSYESLYAPDILLAVLSDPHPDIIQQWLPVADAVASTAAEQVGVQEKHGAAATAAAFPADNSAAGGDTKGAEGSNGMLLSVEASASAAAFQRQKSALLQLQGYASAAQQLLMSWKCGDGSGSGSGTCLVSQLQLLLPQLVSSSSRSAAAGLTTAGSGAQADVAQAAAASAAAADNGPPVGAAAVAGAPPPWGKDVNPAAVVQFVRSPQDLAAAVSYLNLLTMLLQGPSDTIRSMAAAAADRPTERAELKQALNPATALNPNGALGPGGGLDSWSGGVPAQDGLSSQVLVSELLDAGVLLVLDRALRAATCALEASNSDFLWGVRGGDCMVGHTAHHVMQSPAQQHARDRSLIL